ncbi:UDP-N-acetylglucosamine 1-carboxyvinyltransferase [Lederbergia citrea]|uniref:UDP-N-acetylglucosamine 1-carboxyvinyltransferase n=1 Tax=Lederbergia citrea TaxID=2833581 RepID=UPI001BC9FCBE|nr:UDP-N-acetylglucosamine 1-carboxyvinyltransferase [Lederbergia citrea]
MDINLENLLKTNKIRIDGGIQLEGEVSVDGSKNAVLPMIAAACLTKEGQTTLENVPAISDVDAMIGIMDEIGVKYQRDGTTLRIEGNGIAAGYVSNLFAPKLRQSIVFLGALVTSLGEAKIALPGGDKIGGNRPIDFHIQALKALGVEVKQTDGFVHAKAKRLPLKGGHIIFPNPSIGATVTAVLAAVLADGETIIENTPIEPEILGFLNMLKRMGAKIQGDGTSTIIINGVRELKGVTAQTIPDRIEAGTLLIALGLTGGTGTIKGVIPIHHEKLLTLCRNIGMKISFYNQNCLRLEKSDRLLPFQTITGPFPDIPSDLQPLITSLATKCKGISMITDVVYNDRFNHVSELKKLGAEVHIDGRSIQVLGGKTLKANTLYGKDLRATTSLICAALNAQGTSFIHGMEHVHRGHGGLLEKLQKLGAQVSYI